MDEAEKYLQSHTGTCLFPIPNGRGKNLCGAMTFEKDGKFPPFCDFHASEVQRIMAAKKLVSKAKPKGVRIKKV